MLAVICCHGTIGGTERDGGGGGGAVICCHGTIGGTERDGGGGGGLLFAVMAL